MKSFTLGALAVIRWPWLHLALAAALVVPWICYALAGYVEADAQFQLAAGGQRWIRPSDDVLPLSAILAFVVLLLIGLAVDQFRRRRATGR